MTKRKRIEKLNAMPDFVWAEMDPRAWKAAMIAIGVIVGWWIALGGNY